MVKEYYVERIWEGRGTGARSNSTLPLKISQNLSGIEREKLAKIISQKSDDKNDKIYCTSKTITNIIGSRKEKNILGERIHNKVHLICSH
jgi:hypothetical protein